MTIESKLLTIIAIIVIGMFVVTSVWAGEVRCESYCDKFGCYTTCYD